MFLLSVLRLFISASLALQQLQQQPSSIQSSSKSRRSQQAPGMRIIMHFGPKQLFRSLQKNILRHFATLESSQGYFLQLLLAPNGRNEFVKFFQVQNAVNQPAILMYNMPESQQQDLRSPIHPCRPVVQCLCLCKLQGTNDSDIFNCQSHTSGECD